MICVWDPFIHILPPRIGCELDALGRESLQELRLRIHQPPELVLKETTLRLSNPVTREDLSFCINRACQYSPWAASTMAMGYFTLPGGHRMGICGDTVCEKGSAVTFRSIHSLNIRIARDFPGLAGEDIPNSGSVLIIGPPGWGKTTLLRDLARRTAQFHTVAVVDERSELFPPGLTRGNRMDVLSGCGKGVGIEMVLRTMGPSYIAVDEITGEADGQALLQAAGCGVNLLATAHASCVQDLYRRPAYARLMEKNLFPTVLVMHWDKSYHWERLPA